MLIEIHAIQNHSPSNLNRDDLGAPKTCYFGGVLRSRISSQCIKRSIRMSDEFRLLRGGIRTRKLADEIAKAAKSAPDVKKRASRILDLCGIKSKEKKDKENDKSDMLVYTSREAIQEMADILDSDGDKTDEQLKLAFGSIIADKTAVPDMALSGRMLETGVLLNTTAGASLQVANAISTHEIHPEVDYYVAADDIPGDDAGAGYLDEALFVSPLFLQVFFHPLGGIGPESERQRRTCRTHIGGVCPGRCPDYTHRKTKRLCRSQPARWHTGPNSKQKYPDQRCQCICQTR